MKKLILSIVAIFMAVSMFAQDNQEQSRVPNGYQGFIEYGNGWHVFDKTMPNTINLSTTHGFYFNDHMYAGIGVAVDACSEMAIVPVYANVRYVFSNTTTVSPFLGLRLGTYISEKVGTYGDFTCGVRFASKRDFAVSVMLAASYYDKLTYSTWEDYQDEYGDWYNHRVEKTVNPSSISLRIGIEW